MEKIPILTSIFFKGGWFNHQPDMDIKHDGGWKMVPNCSFQNRFIFFLVEFSYKVVFFFSLSIHENEMGLILRGTPDSNPKPPGPTDYCTRCIACSSLLFFFE